MKFADLRSTVSVRVGCSLFLMDQLMPPQVFDFDAFCVAIREATHHSSMSGTFAMSEKFMDEVEAKSAFCAGV